MIEPEAVVCLGASAGGLDALESFLGALPDDTGAAYVVVVHLAPDSESMLPDLLSRNTTMPVLAVSRRFRLQADHVYVIPPGKDLVLEDNFLVPAEQNRTRGRPNLPIDRFLDDLAAKHEDRSIAVILSGTGSDGSRGLRAIHEQGGAVLVQDPGSARFDGMPRSALLSGLVDEVAPPEELARRVATLVAYRSQLGQADDTSLDVVLERLRSGLDSDHRAYRRPMLLRRIRRRMALTGQPNLDAYAVLLDQDPNELLQLQQDLLIGVTGFFRDLDVFDSLRRNVVPDILKADGPLVPVRIWVSACSSGQEAYSMAILFQEEMRTLGIQRPLKIFATDVNRHALETASRATYTATEVADVPEELLEIYFQKRGEDWAVRESIRDSVIFAPHDILRAPPFTRMDLVTCRNLLIYLTPENQARALRSLHFALRPNRGVLLLGSAERPKAVEDRVTALDERCRIYRRTGPASLDLLHGMPRPTLTRRNDGDRAFQLALTEALERRQRTAALVAESGDLLRLYVDPHHYFRLAPGEPSRHLRSFLPASLSTAIASAISRITRQGEPRASLRRRVDDTDVDVEVLPVRQAMEQLAFHVELHPVSQPTPVKDVPPDGERVRELQEEVRTTRETLQSTIEELQATNEELQSTNEELMAANEELQSTNEELHSVNEELSTVNDELQRKNEELVQLTADLDNLLANIEVGTLFLDNELRIRRFTPGIRRVVELLPQDVGRSFTAFAPRLDDSFLGDIELVLRTGEPVDRELRDRQGAWLSMRIRRYETHANLPAGALVTFVDVTRLKTAEKAARLARVQLEDLTDRQASQIDEMLAIVAHDLRRPALGMDGMLELAREDLANGRSDDATDRLVRAKVLLDDLVRMLGGMTEVIRHGRTSTERETVALRPWLTQFLQPWLERGDEEQVELRYHCDDASAHFSRPAAEAALRNLLENSFLHGVDTERPPKIHVSCRLLGEQVRLVVTDNGRGIPADQQDHVFEMFARLAPSEPGTGVGLVSARRMVQRAGGSLSLSDAGPGARFEVLLPVEGGASLEHLLLVEDDAVDARRVEKMLPDWHIVRASDLMEARHELVSRPPPHAILLDLSLPDGHGLGLLIDLRERQIDAPVVILTGLGDAPDSDLFPSEVVAVLQKEELTPELLRETLAAMERS